MLKRLALPTLLVLAALAAAAAPASAAQTVRDGEGVTLTRHGSRVVFHFADTAQGRAAFRRVAGRKVEIACEAPRPVGEAVYALGGGTGTTRAPRRRGPVAVDLHTTDPLAWCSLKVPVPARRSGSDDTVALLGATAEGRVYVDRAVTAASLLSLDLLFDKADRSVAAVVAKTKGYVVALAGPDGTPPYGRVGYWKDGEREVRVAVAKDGHRLFFETEGDVVRTNALSYLDDLEP